MRLLVLLAGAMLIALLARGIIRRIRLHSSSSSDPTSQQSEPMHPCRHCGVYLPASEGVGELPDKFFCSEEHRRQHLSE